MARRVLLADDSVTAQNMGRRILADAGYDVITVNNGSAALKKIAEQKPDLIVLDVYMPGYGGLEVCQRLKENCETASIPVLLSVGKLEPFKADEAKRVQADAFIVKPFEASELLTALTKLEDKIKPQASAQKHGRFGKSEQAGERFGDKETGWKYRLIIPALTDSVLQQDAELEHPKTEGVAQAELKTAEPAQDLKPAEPDQVSDSAIPAGLPKDITPDEIAALAAAAAAFSSREEETKTEVAAQVDDQPAPVIAQAEPVPDQAAAEIPSATLAAAADVQTSAEPATQIDTPAPQPDAGSEAHQTPDIPVPEVETAKPETTEAAANVDDKREDTPDAGKWGKDADVLAALASLLPSSHAAQANGAPESEAKPEETPSSIIAASASTTAATEYIGPRWMAEPVPLMEEETALLLEHEMEKAFAAFAAAEAARINTAVQVPVAIAEAQSNIVAGSPSPDLAAPIEFTAQDAVASSTETIAATEVNEVAYAAAASVSSVSDEFAPAEASAGPLTPPTASRAAAPMEEVDRQTEAELAAAWQNWKQIRESIISSELTSQIADVAAAELNTTEQELPSTDEAHEATADGTEADSDANDAEGPAAIASIVDSVLAELKPKLVAEIARKMKQEKKGKQKKGKK